MTAREVIEVIAELDNFVEVCGPLLTGYKTGDWSELRRLERLGCRPIWSDEREGMINASIPDYMRNKDALFPVILKQPQEIRWAVYRIVTNNWSGTTEEQFDTMIEADTDKWATALVKAVGRWVE